MNLIIKYFDFEKIYSYFFKNLQKINIIYFEKIFIYN